jgi:hypothetical protein
MRRTSAPTAFKRRGRFASVITLVLLPLAISVSAPFLGVSDAAPAGGVQQVGTFSRWPADARAAFGNKIAPPNAFDGRNSVSGSLIAIPARKQFLQLFTSSSDSTGPVDIAVRDMGTMKMTHGFTVPAMPRRTGVSDGGEWTYALDGGRRIFFMGRDRLSVIEVDLKTYAHKLWALRDPVVVAGQPTQGLSIAGFNYDAHGDAVWILYGGFASTSGAQMYTLAYRVDVKTGATASRQLRTCNGQLTPGDQGQTYQFESIITADNFYFVCQRSGSIGAVVRVARPDILSPSSAEEIVAGPAYLETALADPVSGRLFLITIAAEIWAFDVKTMAFVGVVAAGQEGTSSSNASYGLDALTGRLTFLSSTYGLGYAEGRFYPIPQARTFPALKASGQERIFTDNVSGYIYVLVGRNNGREDSYRVYDFGTAPLPPSDPDPDGNTADIDEAPGVTESRYFSSGTGYGARALLVRGIHAVPPAPVAGQVAPTADLFVNQIHSKCGFNDRELVAGRVARAEYDTGSTAAQAVGVDVDERTKLDLEHLSRCDLNAPTASSVFKGIFGTVPQATAACDKTYDDGNDTTEDPSCDSGRKWTTTPAYCTSSTGGDSEGQPKSTNEAPSRGEVSCPQPGGMLTATAVGHLSGPIAVGKAETVTQITRGAKGVLSAVTSEAQDIKLTEAIHIGEVTATATSRSNGRPSSSPMSTYTVVFKGIRVVLPDGAVTVCEQFTRVVATATKDTAKNCNIDATMAALNTVAGGRAEFRLGSGLDAKLLRGSAKGALTAVQKSLAKQASDQALVGDKTVEVPGLELIVYNDNKSFGRARQLYQFAGVATAATYNIAKLPFGAGFDDLSDDDAGGGLSDAMFSPSGEAGSEFLPNDGLLTNGETASAVTEGAGGGGAFRRALRALARGIRMFLTDPRQALLLLTAWGLFSLPAVLSRRRRLLAAVRSD